jgi:hypothetical protein
MLPTSEIMEFNSFGIKAKSISDNSVNSDKKSYTVRLFDSK